MRLIDLTLPIENSPAAPAVVSPYTLALQARGQPYTAICYRLAMNGMSGTYVDFPGHIVECDDGRHAGNYPLERLFMLDATVLHLAIPPTGHGVTAEELDAAGVAVKGKVLIVHALGDKGWMDIDPNAISWYAPSAIDWIVRQRPEIFISDIYEKRPDQQGIFGELFRRHISTVCCPVNLHELRAPYGKCCIIPLKLPGVMQLPCRCFVIEE